MVISPKVRGFICTTAHPKGCKENIKNQIKYVKSKGKFKCPKNVLIIGASTGYGLASRISLSYGADANTLGIMFEKESSSKRTATAGYYNTKYFEEFAKKDGLYAETINGDAFSREIKNEAIEKIKKDLGKIDLVIYSLAAPKRITEDGHVYSSTLKTIDKEFTNKSLDLRDNTINKVTIPVANKEEIESTVKVMGGEDWLLWLRALKDADVLSNEAKTIAYSYIGPKLTYPIYYSGTIGMAKKNLCETCYKINNDLKDLNVKAYISVNKALVTAASAAIPIVPLYISILYKVMKQKNLHEGCIEQMYRLYSNKFNNSNPSVNEESLIRLDDYEMKEEVQNKVIENYNLINTENIREYADIDGYYEDFYHMFGFNIDNVDYDEDILDF